MHLNILTVFPDAGFGMRQAQQLAEQSIEVSTNTNWRNLAHSAILTMMTDEIRPFHSLTKWGMGPSPKGTTNCVAAVYHLDNNSSVREFQGNGEQSKMANKKKTSKKKAQPKATAPAKSGEPVIIAFKKDAPEGALPPQAAEILAIVKTAGKLDRDTVLKKMEGRVKTRQPMRVIWSFYRSKLVRGGFVAVT